MENNDENNSNNTSLVSKEKLDQVAAWLGSAVASAFFSSLERFSCVNVTTTDPDEDDDGEPLILSTNPDPNIPTSTSTSIHGRLPNDVVDLAV